jgi:hypothetical protein
MSVPPSSVYYGMRPTESVRPYQNRNWTLERKDILVENVRGYGGPSIRPAFSSTTVLRYKSFAMDDEEIMYYRESVEQLLHSEVTGASKVTIFNHSELALRFLLERYLTLSCRQLCNAPVPDRLILTQQTDNLCPKHMLTKLSLLPLLGSISTPRTFEAPFLNRRPIGVPALGWSLALRDYRSKRGRPG